MVWDLRRRIVNIKPKSIRCSTEIYVRIIAAIAGFRIYFSFRFWTLEVMNGRNRIDCRQWVKLEKKYCLQTKLARTENEKKLDNQGKKNRCCQSNRAQLSFQHARPQHLFSLFCFYSRFSYSIHSC